MPSVGPRRPGSPWPGRLAPVAVLLTDEGLNGLPVHLVNDTEDAVAGQLQVEVYSADHLVDQASGAVLDPGPVRTRSSADALFDGFRDLDLRLPFGPRGVELVVVRLVAGDGAVLARASFLPGGLPRPVQAEIGLQASLEQVDEKAWSLTVSPAGSPSSSAWTRPGIGPTTRGSISSRGERR